ncbi:hypothetical protein TNCV_4202911 [Trichonephila clavipes]|uniref:Uncharacterized protein n=1 Tax=Trichonephila clavipes TaxID=2585209 RepID=A0A8X6S983_TRICX|nr:hypothetical protein TNCV_4202911 [Trichonephila clavipes]
MWNTPVEVMFLVQPSSGVLVMIRIMSSSSFQYDFIRRARKWIANDDFQQNRYSGNLPVSAIYHKVGRKNLPKRQKFHAASLSNFPDDSCAQFQTPKL